MTGTALGDRPRLTGAPDSVDMSQCRRADTPTGTEAGTRTVTDSCPAHGLAARGGAEATG